MSGAAVDVAVRLGLQDGASGGIEKAAARAQAAAQKTASTVEGANARQRTSYEKVSLAREVLGVRSEQRIQREIAQTEAAYKRLAQTGKLSATEQARAQEASRAKVAALTNEMGKLTAAQERAAKGAKALQIAGAGLAGGAAAAYTLAAPVRHAMSVDERLRDMANMAYRGRGVADKRAGMTTMRDAIDGSVASYGGTRQGATDALSSLLENGVDAGDAVKTLPTLMKYSTASSADPAQLAQIAMRAMQNFKIDAKDVPSILNMALAAGSAGGFELKDMAKWLPQQMALAKSAGMSGKKDFGYLLALNQAAVRTAGTKDEAGNNVVNLLAKIMSSDTANDAKKLGINHYGYLQKKRSEGMNSLEAFTALVDSTVGKRADYQAIKVKLAATKDEGERKVMLESMADIAQGAGIGKLIQDRQALGAVLASLQQRGFMDKVRQEVAQNDLNEGGIGEEFFGFKSEGGAYKANKRKQSVEAAQDRVIGDGGGALGAVNDAIADMAAKFPELTGGASLAATALTAAAGAAGLFTLAAGGGGVKGKVGGAITNAAGRAMGMFTGPGMLATASRFAGGVGLAGTAGYAVGSGLSWLIDKGVQKGTGDKDQTLGTWIYELLNPSGSFAESLKGKDAAKPMEPPKPAEVNASLQVGLAPGLVLYTQEFKANGANVKMDTGNIMTGAM